jgi:hypothetical protein
MTSDFRREIIVVSFATAISELFASLRFLIEVPFGEVARARPHFLRLFAGICIKHQ